MIDQTQNKVIDLQDALAGLIATRWMWEGSTIPVVQRTFGYLHKLTGAGAELRREADATRRNDRLTDAGKRDHLAKFIAANFAPAFRTADVEGRRGIKAAIETLRAQGVRAIDKTDVAAAILRMDLRRIWFDMKSPAKVALMHNPPAILATAILELPREMHGLDEAKEDELREAAFSHDFPDHANDIAELKDVLEFTATAITLARDEVTRNAEIDRRAFNEIVWHGQPVDSEVA